MSPIRVSFLIDSLSRAGTETQLLALIRALDRSRVVPSLALLDGTSEDSRALEPDDCSILRLGLKSFKNLPATAKTARMLAQFWRNERVDVVQTYFLDSTYFGVPLARACGIRNVIRVRNNVGHWLTPKHRTLGRIVGRIAHTTMTNSEPGRAALQAAEGLPSRKLVVLENGVDLDQFSTIPPPARSAGVTIGTMANLRPVKGVDVLIRAAVRVIAAQPNAKFLIAGEGEQRPELEQLIASLGLGESVRLMGRVSDVPGFIAQLDLAVLPSHAEGMSNALLEFMAAGRPVVATAVGANPQLLLDGATGLLTPPGDDQAMATALLRVIDDRGLAEQFASAARRHVCEHYDRTAMRDRFQEYYERLCA